MLKTGRKKLMTCILCMVLMVAMALGTAGCNGSTKKDDAGTQAEDSAGNGASDTWADGSVIGEGSKEFIVTVTDNEGSETKLEIHTDEETVGAALSELGLIDGEESEYGLYVKTVMGITVDYDKDGAYWAFYINGEYAQTGVDATNITEGDSYAFKIEKG